VALPQANGDLPCALPLTPRRAAGRMSQQTVSEQQAVSGVVDGAEGQPQRFFRRHARRELQAGQSERDEFPLSGPIFQIFDVHLRQPERGPLHNREGARESSGSLEFHHPHSRRKHPCAFLIFQPRRRHATPEVNDSGRGCALGSGVPPPRRRFGCVPRPQPSLEDVFEFLPSVWGENPQSGWVTMCLERKKKKEVGLDALGEWV